MRTGVADLPLHPGRAPAWLMSRMARLGASVVEAIVDSAGRDALLARLADPFWFQALGCLLGFDWHSSGVTTTVTGALQIGIAHRQRELGVWVCGGKGRRSRRTPDQIRAACEHLGGIDPAGLVRASRLSAKVDSAAVQDGYQLYHHAFVMTREGRWAVVQQGMSDLTGMARRYHWLGAGVRRFDESPHAAVACDVRAPSLDLTAEDSGGSRSAIVELARMEPRLFDAELSTVRRLTMPARHEVTLADIGTRRFQSIRLSTYEAQPQDLQELLGTAGLGARSLRSLALLAEVIFGVSPSFEDPARFSFAHGGKDGHPFPVDRATYDETIATLEGAVGRARVGDRQRLEALRRLDRFLSGRQRGEGALPPGPRDGQRAVHGAGPLPSLLARDEAAQLPLPF